MAKAMPVIGQRIDTYGELKEAIQLWCDRDDDEFVNEIPVFVDFAQRQIMRTLRIPALQKEAYLEIKNGYAYVPSDYLQGVYVRFTGNDKLVRETSLNEVKYQNQNKYHSEVISADDVVDDEIIMALMQNQFAFAPKINCPLPTENPDGSVTCNGTECVMSYYWDIPPMKDDSDTSILLTLAPDLMLYLACASACRFTKDAGDEQSLIQIADGLFKQLEKQTTMMLGSNGPAAIPYARPHRFF